MAAITSKIPGITHALLMTAKSFCQSTAKEGYCNTGDGNADDALDRECPCKTQPEEGISFMKIPR